MFLCLGVFQNISYFISTCKLIRCTNTSRRQVATIYKTEHVHHTDLEMIELSMHAINIKIV